MIYEFKLVPRDRQTGSPAFNPKDTEPQVRVDLALFETAMSAARTGKPLEPTTALGSLDEAVLRRSIARALSEMFGADVYFRREGEERWQNVAVNKGY